jgi:hypothetical protein
MLTEASPVSHSHILSLVHSSPNSQTTAARKSYLEDQVSTFAQTIASDGDELPAEAIQAVYTQLFPKMFLGNNMLYCPEILPGNEKRHHWEQSNILCYARVLYAWDSDHLMACAKDTKGEAYALKLLWRVVGMFWDYSGGWKLEMSGERDLDLVEAYLPDTVAWFRNMWREADRE